MQRDIKFLNLLVALMQFVAQSSIISFVFVQDRMVNKFRNYFAKVLRNFAEIANRDIA
jgi:hypothetical protein